MRRGKKGRKRREDYSNLSEEFTCLAFVACLISFFSFLFSSRKGTKSLCRLEGKMIKKKRMLYHLTLKLLKSKTISFIERLLKFGQCQFF